MSNSTRWQSWKEAVIELPFTIIVENKTPEVFTLSQVINSSFLSLKNSGALLDYITVTFNNVNTVQLTNFQAHFISWKLLSTMSGNAELVNGAQMFFAKDTATSFKFDGTGQDGNGLTNNRATSATTADDMSTQVFHGATYNAGFRSRIQNTAEADTGSFYADIIEEAQMRQSGINNFNATANIAKYSILCTIRLGDIDFFQKLPLIRGGFVQMTVGFNASLQTLSYDITADTLTSTAPIVTGHANPLMIASAANYEPNNWLAGLTGNSSLYVAGNPVTVQDSTGTSHSNNILTSSRVVMPLYSFNPTFEKSYIENEPIRDIFYEDVYQYTISGIEAGGNINQILTNGLSRPRYLVIIPTLNKDSHTGYTSTEVYNSPFSSEPGTTCPSALVTNYNILLSGTPVYAQNFTYSYEQFIYEAKAILSLNGAESDRMLSGLISYQDYQFGYRWLVTDLSRRISSDNISRSIQVIGTNNTKVKMDYICFVTYEKSIRMDIRNSQLFPTQTV